MAEDSIQQRLTGYSLKLAFRDLPAEVVHAAKVRVIDALGVLLAGFDAEPCRILRKFASRVPDAGGATIIGTRSKVTPEMAAFVNASTMRYLEFSDLYHWPGSYNGHPSDVIMPVLAAAEYAKADGRAFLTGVVLAYEVYSRMCDVFTDRDFDNTNFGCVATAAAAGKLLGLAHKELADSISMAVVSNNTLRQVRQDHLTIWKEVAAGQGGRAGVFAALLAQAGVEGPSLPFEGRSGWCDHVAHGRFKLGAMGGDGATFKILDSHIRHRPCMGEMISSVLAAEKIATLQRPADVQKILIETYKYAKERVGTGESRCNPKSREDADHSIPYVVAATLLDGTIAPDSFDDAHLGNAQLRALLSRSEVVENPEFTRIYDIVPREHHTRVTVTMSDDRRLVGEAGGGDDDLSAHRTDEQIVIKFRSLVERPLGKEGADRMLDFLWNLDAKSNAAAILSEVVLGNAS